MKIKRKIWALLLSAAMIFTLLPAAVFADDTVLASGDAAETSAPAPKYVNYDGPTLRGIVGTDKLTNLEIPEISDFIVTFDDGSTKTFTYIEKEYDDSTGDKAGAFLDVDDPVKDPLEADTWIDVEVRQDAKVSFKEEWNENVELQVVVHYVIPGDGAEEFATKTLYTNVDVLCAPDSVPTAVEFIPAEGFTPECIAGFDYLTEENFYGEGNKFKVSYYGWMTGDPEKGIEDGFENFTRTYEYAKGTNSLGEEVEGFFSGGNVDKIPFVLDEGAPVDLDFGKVGEAEFTYTEYVETYDDFVSVDFKVPVKATKYNIDVNFPVFTYTGKVIKPTFKVYNAKGKLIPAKSYDVKYEKASKMGWYEATITFNDNFADKDKYVDSITTSYGIGPKAPTIYNPVAGKKSLKVKWKKLTAAQLKNVDKFCIELSTDKYFMGNYKRVWLNKKAIKKGKKTVTGLKKGKKYYVRIYAYKTIKQGGEKFKMESNYSKVKVKKTK